MDSEAACGAVVDRGKLDAGLKPGTPVVAALVRVPKKSAGEAASIQVPEGLVARGRPVLLEQRVPVAL